VVAGLPKKEAPKIKSTFAGLSREEIIDLEEKRIKARANLSDQTRIAIGLILIIILALYFFSNT